MQTEREVMQRLEALKFATNYFCSGASIGQPKKPNDVMDVASAFYAFLTGAGNGQLALRVDGDKGTTFMVYGDKVVITRKDQPVCEVPLDDFKQIVNTDTPF